MSGTQMPHQQEPTLRVETGEAALISATGDSFNKLKQRPGKIA